MKIVVFDVESVGLHGAGFAVGAVVIDTAVGLVVEEYYAAFDPRRDEDTWGIREKERWGWIEQNVLPALPDPPFTHGASYPFHADFWKFWRKWAEQGARLVADCAWPVEARFLAECVDWEWPDREWQGPYPLLDISSVLWARGLNPTQTFDRWPNELPAHNPLNDARQSARILLGKMRNQETP